MTDDPPTISIEANFVSPVTPADIFRQTIPFSYLHLTVNSLDDRAHEVEVYTEINGLWLADKEQEEIEWESTGEKEWRGMRIRLKDQRPFKEEQIEEGWTADRILAGDVWYAAQASNKVETTFSAGDSAVSTREAFATTGRLPDISNHTSPRTTRTRNDKNSSLVLDEPVFAFAHSFGFVYPSTPHASRSQLLTIGHIRDPIVQYMTAGEETVSLRPLWRSTFPTAEQLISFHLSDYANSLQLSNAYNKKLYADARRVDSEEYAHVVSISTRQVFAALEAVWDESAEGSDGKELLVAYSPITGKPIPTMGEFSSLCPELSCRRTAPHDRATDTARPSLTVMLKEVSSNGNCGTVDVLAPFLPFMVYACPSLLPLILEPTIRYSATGLYTPIPPPHDIGDHYPLCIGQ